MHITIDHLTVSTEEHQKLIEKYGEQMVIDVYEGMMNSAGLKKYKSGYLTANNWCKARLERQKQDKATPQKSTPKKTSFHLSESRFADYDNDQLEKIIQGKKKGGTHENNHPAKPGHEKE